MALPAGTVWEVRAAGNDANGGGFVAGAAGTDFSQQDAAQYGGANLAVDGAVNTKVTSATHNFVAADVGNILQVTAGAGWTQGFYQILSVAANAATLDRSPAAVGTAGGTYAVGGALASPGKAGAGAEGGNWIWIKAATYTIASAAANVPGGCVSLGARPGNADMGRVVGYGATRGDGGRPTLQAGSISTFTIVTTGVGNSAENLIVDGMSRTAARGIHALNGRAINCKVLGCTNVGINGGVQILCEASGCSLNVALGPLTAFGCWSHDNTTGNGVGIAPGASNAVMIDCVASNNVGPGFSAGFVTSRFINCTSYGNGGHGFDLNSNSGVATVEAINCLAYGNTGAGFNSGANNIGVYVINPFVGSNSGGAIAGILTVFNQFNLTADPFVNGAAGNFALNTAPGGGALVRGAGLPGTFPGLLSRSWRDGGAVQHRDTGQAFTFIS